MKSTTTTRFRRLFDDLPDDIQDEARKAYRRFRANPYDPILEFKSVRGALHSVRVMNTQFRALGMKQRPDYIVWGWIGSHTQYMQMIDRY